MDLEELNRLVEDKQAPGALVAVQAFLNTCDYEYGEELLGDPRSTAAWLASTDLAAPEITVGPVGHRRLRELRTTLRSIVESHQTGEEPAAAIEELRGLTQRHPIHLATDPSGGVGLDLAPAATVDALISQLLGLVFEAQRGGRWRRLKTCAAGAGIEPPAEVTAPGECRWVFYDASKNRGGHWCQMGVCGNRSKNRTYRARAGRRGSS